MSRRTTSTRNTTHTNGKRRPRASPTLTRYKSLTQVAQRHHRAHHAIELGIAFQQHLAAHQLVLHSLAPAVLCLTLHCTVTSSAKVRPRKSPTPPCSATVNQENTDIQTLAPAALVQRHHHRLSCHRAPSTLLRALRLSLTLISATSHVRHCTVTSSLLAQPRFRTNTRTSTHHPLAAPAPQVRTDEIECRYRVPR